MSTNTEDFQLLKTEDQISSAPFAIIVYQRTLHCFAVNMQLLVTAFCSFGFLSIAEAASHVRPRYPYGSGPSPWDKRAAPIHNMPWHKRQISANNNNGTNSTGGCPGNTASDRSSWCDFSIDDDWYLDGPDTGKTVEYWFELVNTTISPDGVERLALTVNGTIPGPTIEGNAFKHLTHMTDMANKVVLL